MTSGFHECYSAIMAARLSEPLAFVPFTVFFDQHKLDEIRGYFGADLFRECLTAAEEAVGSLAY